MKKLMFALVLGALLVLALATTALADNGPHGSFTATTDACASCHRAHSAQFGSNALLIMDPEALCLSCHDGTGAGTNVEDGIYVQAGADAYYGGGTTEGDSNGSLFGGGFTNTLMATAWSGKVTPDAAFDATSRTSTSMHNVGVNGTVWGAGARGTAPDAEWLVLECTSCHDPHGTAGWDVTVTPAVKTASYRLLRWQPSGSNGFTPPATNVNWSGGAFPTNGSATGWTVPDNYATIGTEWYTIGTQSISGSKPFAVGDYNAGNANLAYQPLNTVTAATQTYVSAAVNVAYFCAQCHDRYFVNSRLRNATDQSFFCGHPQNNTTVVGTVTLPLKAPVLNAVTGLYEHPDDPLRCLPQGDPTSAATITSWGDNGDSGDAVYMYQHSTGDIRVSMDGSVAAGGGTSVSRSCVACHVSHGSSAEMTAFASDATLAAVPGGDIDNSVLLRMDNRSLCLRCHASTVNFTVGP